MKTQEMNNEGYSESYYRELIFDYLNSSLSKEEENILMDWLAKDKANKRYFDECHEVWLSVKLNKAQQDFDSQKAFQRFTRSIGRGAGNSRVMFRKLHLSVASAAAVVMVVFALGVLTYSLLSSRKTGKPTYFSITVPPGSKTRMHLPDGTQVWLNAQSKLTYASDYNQTTREVKLEGEGYFKVAHDDKRPFLVNTSKITIRALGTEFNVKCYNDEGLIETTLVKGSVKIEENEKKKSSLESAIILKPNEKLIFVKQTGRIFLKSDSLETDTKSVAQADIVQAKEELRKEKIIVKAIDPMPLIAWKEDKLVFTGERFDEILIKIERWYGVSVQVKDEEILSYRFKGSFEKETLEQALEALKLASHFDYTIIKDQVIITK